MSTREQQREEFQAQLNYDRHKLSSKNFDKLMKQRGLNSHQIQEMKNSMEPGFETCHAKAGEPFTLTHGQNYASGNYLTKNPVGNTPQECIDKLALPPSNPATEHTRVVLDKDQNLVFGKVAPQPTFQKDGIPRTGGVEQVITNGGLKSGAIRTEDSKHPISVQDHCFQTSSLDHSISHER